MCWRALLQTRPLTAVRTRSAARRSLASSLTCTAVRACTSLSHSVTLSVRPYFSQSVCLSACLPAWLFVYLSVCLCLVVLSALTRGRTRAGHTDPQYDGGPEDWFTANYTRVGPLSVSLCLTVCLSVSLSLLSHARGHTHSLSLSVLPFGIRGRSASLSVVVDS